MQQLFIAHAFDSDNLRREAITAAGRTQPQRLRANAKTHAWVRVIFQLSLQRRRQFEGIFVTNAQPDTLRAAGNRHIVQVHRRAADKLGDKAVGRLVVEIDRFIHLHNGPPVQHANAVTHGHCLHLIVGDIHHGGGSTLLLELIVQFDQLNAHRDPQLGIKVGQRFIEQKYLGLAHNGTADRYTLALAAG
ncbi:hypothetical protein D3C81_1365350 [compost metagenome]